MYFSPRNLQSVLQKMCDSREFCRSSRDSTVGINFDALGDVEHFEHVSGDLFDLFKSGENSDVVFVINGTRFEAHRIILAARCNYFKVLLFGEMREARSDADIPIVDTTPDAFHALLEYIYSGRICLADVKEEVCVCVSGITIQWNPSVCVCVCVCLFWNHVQYSGTPLI